jgi:membrane associated rhomboid family serine protease
MLVQRARILRVRTFLSLPAMAPVTQILLIVNVVAFFLQTFAEPVMMTYFALWPLHMTGGPPEVGFQPWQLVTYSFLHGGLTHLLFNMLALYMFGSDLERVFGSRRFTIYYFVSVVSAALAQLAISTLGNLPPFPTVGASGGVFGLLLAFGLYFPRRMVMLLFPPIPMPAWLFVSLYGALELFLGVTGTQQGVAHFAHLGGMLGGYLTIRVWRSRSRLL